MNGDWQTPPGGGFGFGGSFADQDVSTTDTTRNGRPGAFDTISSGANFDSQPGPERSYERRSSRGSGDLGAFGDEQTRSIAKAFAQARSSDGFVHAEEGKRRLQETGLPNEILHKIWSLSDMDRDGRLSLREFVCAMHLSSEAKLHRPLPTDLDHKYQEVLVKNVERMVATGVSLEDYGTTDTRIGRSGAFDTTSVGGNFGTEERYLAHEEDRRGVRDFNTIGGRRTSGLGFDASGELGRRGRDPTPRSLPGTRSGDRRPAIDDTLGIPDPGAGLGQLASVFEVTARLDATGELRRISKEVLEERRGLEQQLARRRDFERQLQEVRGQLEALREERRRVEVESSASQRHAAHLQDELGFVEREVKDSEQDLNALREQSDTSRIRRGSATPYASAEEERRDVLSKVRAEKELLQRDQRGIEELRLKLEDVFKDKLDAQVLQQQLLEKQRQSEQDRGLMLTAIEAERGKLSAMRAERIRMWEERSALEREMTDILQERWLAEHRGPARSGRPEKDFANGMGVPIGVPTEQYYRSAPGDIQRNEVGNGNYASMRRHTGDGNYRNGMQGGGIRMDSKGVRNEEVAFGGTPFN